MSILVEVMIVVSIILGLLNTDCCYYRLLIVIIHIHTEFASSCGTKLLFREKNSRKRCCFKILHICYCDKDLIIRFKYSIIIDYNNSLLGIICCW